MQVIGAVTANGSSLSLNGNSANSAGSGTGVNIGGSILGDADSILNITGYSNGGDGVHVNRSNISVNGGTINITGVASNFGTGVDASGVNGTFVLSCGTVTVNGTSNLGVGLGGFDGSNVVLNGTADVTLIGMTNGSGLGAILGDILVTDEATLNITGISGGNSGVSFSGGLGATDNATIAVTGVGGVNANNGGSGILISGDVSSSGANTVVDLNGTGGVGGVNGGSGVTVGGGLLSDGGGSILSVNGTGGVGGTNGGSGASVGGDIIADGNGSSITVESQSRGNADGLDAFGALSATGGSAISLHGVSEKGIGVNASGTSVVLDGTSETDITGESDAGAGVVLGASGEFLLKGSAALNVTGISNTGDGVDLGNVTVTDDAVLNVSGTTVAGAGVLEGPDSNVEVSGNGTLNLDGAATGRGDGVVLNGTGNVTDNAVLNINGSAVTGIGAYQTRSDNSTLFISGDGVVNAFGSSDSGIGADFNSHVVMTDNSELNVSGTSNSGTAVVLSTGGVIDASGNSTVTINGTSESGSGVQQQAGSTLNVSGPVIVNITGNSNTGLATFLDGSIENTGGGNITIFGNSTNNNVGLDFGSQSSVNTSGANSTTFIAGFDKSGNFTLGTPENSNTSAGGTLTLCRNELTNCTDPFAPPPDPEEPGGGGGGGGGGGAGAVAGAAGGLLLGFLMLDSDEIWALEKPIPLESDTGLLGVWCNAMLDYVEINEEQSRALVRLHTQDKVLERRLVLRDSSDGVNHYTLIDPQNGETAELSYKTDSHEFFYKENGPGSNPYDVKAHGWLAEKSDSNSAENNDGSPNTSGNYKLDDTACAPPVVEEPAPIPVIVPPPPVKQMLMIDKPISIDGANFSTDSSKLRPTADERLAPVLQAATDYPEIQLEVSGHTDSTGSDAHNQGLSERRAAAVKTWLVNHGVAADRITTVGYGETRPIDTNATATGRAANRRVEVRYVIHEEKVVPVQ
jgi:outer membrane protein OmpA-like peptidoglycan-associated protein